jgi:hypothetical protein
MNWKKPSPKPSVSSLQTTQKPGSITASMVYSKTENALALRETSRLIPSKARGLFRASIGTTEVVPCYKAQRVDPFITRLSKIDIHLSEIV